MSKKKHVEALKRFKKSSRLVVVPSLGVLGAFSFGVWFVCSIFYFDYTSVAKSYDLSDDLDTFVLIKLDNNNNIIKNIINNNNRSSKNTRSSKRVEFLEESGNGCDVFDGDWVRDESYPLYQSKDCRFLDAGFRCSEFGRSDLFYTQWRWQPRHCSMPRFDAKVMLEKLRNKRIVFVGDSIGRNQWESLLCLLSSAVKNQSSVYEVNGSPITKHNGFLLFKFDDYNCTVEYYRSPFLVPRSRPPIGSPKKVKSTLKLDTMDWTSDKWRDADVLVLNTGHWWNYGKTIRTGCYFQEGEKVKLKMDVDEAYKRAMETMVKWIQTEVDSDKTQVFFRTLAPVHFRGGDWKSGGTCHKETLPEIGGTSLVSSDTWEQFKILRNVLSHYSNTSETVKMKLLNITSMAAQRKDGHPSVYYLGPLSPAPRHRQDCSHWCLPGVPDTWNELLYALFMKQEASSSSSKRVQESKSKGNVSMSLRWRKQVNNNKPLKITKKKKKKQQALDSLALRRFKDAKLKNLNVYL